MFILYKNTIDDFVKNETIEKIFIKLPQKDNYKYILCTFNYHNKKFDSLETKQYDNYNFDDIIVPNHIKVVLNKKLLDNKNN